MEDMLKKLKMRESKMPAHEKDAKMSVLSHLRDKAQESMSGKLNGLKKISIMSDKSEGLEEGLDKAKELIQSMGDELEEPLEESMEEDDSESEEMSPEDIDIKIAKLQELKNRMVKA